MSTRVVEVDPERLEGWLERFAANNPGPDAPQRVVGTERFDHLPLAVVLVRRGGYAVGLADGAAYAASKVGTRHVQSRTSAGGWSQQRFARRRGNQADELVRAVTDHAARLLLSPRPAGLVVGGDKALVRDVLADPRLAALADLPRRELYDLPDPRRSVLEDALRRGRVVRVTVEDR
ncbi:acVLRF1 family peptidyl-tRNA hydrolase [Phycicoccus sp. M110.8]|uniref:acVLRF1 family peptidyl-tRNA hydrolase n=1 Tax=Phycicoccus sp. M110.8 TaxID=3075433 RepID=UPI0028FCFFB5|nr:acVLRF1 family peptidyl-tRNA hydrolase [Phycicoccus sp. M110.8]MDU0315871.1 acVLRF1 family peptidyl-tRNA hydrolase [Phycicoccus sp. M110.8]